ncbi:hypothetical protein L1049_026839 [Liquidambar formosana]|uniref:Uncharacterized protein n=1 Tax=Liquidambar formosana TaxID=63359 RepID=A0AAP0NHS4_LIQFO
MGSRDEQLHVIFLPYMTPGHMMPLVDMARLFAAHGVKVTIITTPMNAARFKSAVDRDSLHPTPELTIKLFHAIGLLQPKIEHLLRERRPDCIASDVLFPWTVDIAAELGIPRLAFSGSGFFNHCLSHRIGCYEPHKNIESETETFVVPCLPDPIKLTRSQLPDIVKTRTEFSELFEKLKEAERKSFGMLMNSFYELEPAYVDCWRKEIGTRAWLLGPVSLFNRDPDDKAERGDKASVNEHSCLSWLNSKKPNSVLYICFGSLTRFSEAQLTEIASALEDSGCFFIWVVGKVLKTTKDDEKDGPQESIVLEGFEERMEKSGKGLIVRGWAPQVLKIGAAVGNEIWKVWAMQETELISRDKIRKAVNVVMNEGHEGEEMRKKTRQLGELANKAVEEGGSSYNDLKALIEEIRSYGRS